MKLKLSSPNFQEKTKCERQLKNALAEASETPECVHTYILLVEKRQGEQTTIPKILKF